MRKLTALTVLLILSFLPFSKAFADDITGIKLEKEVRAMAELGVIQGYSEGVYGPHDKVTRAQFATFIARALELPDGPHVFTDVNKEGKLTKWINAAAAAKIVNGYTPTTFKPEDSITRGQIALMINNALNYLNVETKNTDIAFIDQSSFSPAAKIAISNMVGNKITSGYPVGDGYAFKPSQTATRAEAAAFIYRMLQVVQEEEKDDLYRIATVSSDGKLAYQDSSFATFEEADKAIQDLATQVIVQNKKIVKMGSGIAFTTSSSSGFTTIYTKTPFTDANVYSGVNKSNEMEYVTSDADKVTVKVAGQKVYVKHNEVTLFPMQSIQDDKRTFYTKNTNGDLILRRYDHVKKEFISYSTVGKAPSTFAVNDKYYSWDGSTFTDKEGKSVGTYYQYFNMLPLRTATYYTAAELDKVIMQNLETKESSYRENPSVNAIYKDATKKSKLIGLGKKLKEVEAEHKINALLMLGFAISESDFGMSEDAQRLNNLFGIEAYDDREGDSRSFAAPEDSIVHLATSLINKDYLIIEEKYPVIAVLGDRASGGVLGNKARGMNVRYATDPYWGQIIAGHVYLLDKALGGKDFLNNANPYKLYETNSFLNVRSSEGVKSTNLLFTYPRPGYVVAAIEQNGEWTKILSDNNTDKYAYVSSQYLEPMTIAK